MAQKNLIKRLISSPLVQTFLIYISGGWIVLEMADYFINHYGLIERVRDILLVILLAGLPVAIILAWFLSNEKDADKTKRPDAAADKKSRNLFSVLGKKPWFTIPGLLLVILLIVSGIRYFHRQNKIRWATSQAIDEIYSYWGNRNHTAAFNLINKALKYAPDDPEIKAWASRAIARVTFLTDPPGAGVYLREYTNQNGDWKHIGTTPIDSIKMPADTYYECRFELEEHDTVKGVLSTRQDTVFRKMFKEGTVPEGMVHIYAFSRDFSEGIFAPKRDFFIDTYEVTNRQYKEFVDSGGYRNPAYWNNEFVKDGKTLMWEEAMAEFTDKTSRPGPATWEASNYPEEQDDYPVNGISWYEAAAYAEFAGKELPSLYHWYSAAGSYIDPFYKSFGQFLIPLSNMKDSGPTPVGHYGGFGCFGNYDMAGNVREWCWNKTQDFCVLEKISFQTAYENERMTAYLFLPKQGKPPYQALIFFPGSYAVEMDSLPLGQVRYFANFLPKNNIAIMWPIYKGTYERFEDLGDMHMPNESHTYTEYLVKWVKDYSRSIDYLETRSDIDSEKIGYYGHSWGGALGAIIPAVEERSKLSIIICGGLISYAKAYPEADQINYVTRVKTPVLMLHGKYDFDLQYETDAKPMYDLLGTPEKDKVLKVYETDHFVPKSERIKETLNFMEKYFGPAMN